jgi:hypothetical protein
VTAGRRARLASPDDAAVATTSASTRNPASPAQGLDECRCYTCVYAWKAVRNRARRPTHYVCPQRLDSSIFFEMTVRAYILHSLRIDTRTTRCPFALHDGCDGCGDEEWRGHDRRAAVAVRWTSGTGAWRESCSGSRQRGDDRPHVSVTNG